MSARVVYVCRAPGNPWPLSAPRMRPLRERMNAARSPRLNRLTYSCTWRSLSCQQRLAVGLDGYDGWLS